MGAIFISHSSRNNEQAADLARRLREKNYQSMFLDFHPEDGIPAGRSWERTLYRSLRACQAVIAICTDDYLQSQWCFAEIALARMERKEVFALITEPLTMPLPSILEDKQYIEMRDPASLEEGYQRLWNGLDEIGLQRVKGDWKEPYLGLSAFDEAHAPIFFGREEETRAGLRLLGRGAPGLIMVLGASGSGKSSLVRAGMIPQLRLDTKQWIVLDPFQPGREPFRELATSLEHAFRRHAPDDDAGSSWESMSRRLEQAGRDCLEAAEASGAARESEVPDDSPPAERAQDVRVAALLEQLGKFARTPPGTAAPKLRNFLELSLAELREIFDDVSASSSSGDDFRAGPLVELAERLRRGFPESRHATVLIVVDQFEELLGPEAADSANAFLALLRSSLESVSSPIVVLGTMRSDFLSSFQKQPLLGNLEFETLSLGPMGPDAILRVIRRPAELAHVELEEGLPELLLEHTGTSDALPLLSFTLWKLWNDCGSDNKLDIAEYKALGELRGAIANEAEELLAGASKNDLAILREAFVQMARPTDDGGYARKAVTWSELPDEARPILERFIDKRLLMTRAEGEVEVAHEALFRSWQKLRTWLDDHRAEMMLHDQLSRDATLWSERGKQYEFLWRGGRLLQAAELLSNQRGRTRRGAAERAQSSLPAEFVAAGLSARRRRRRMVVGGTVSVIVVLLVFSVVSWQLKIEANQQETLARARLTAFQAGQLLDSDHTQAQRLATEAYALVEDAPSAEVQRVLSDAFHTLHQATGDTGGGTHSYLHQQPPGPKGHGVVSVEVAAHGDLVVTAWDDGKIRLWKPYRAAGLVEFGDAGGPRANSAVLSPDGERILAAYDDGVARLWDIATGERIAQFPRQGGSTAAAVSQIDVALFQPRGQRILTACSGSTAAAAECSNAEVRLWDETGELLATLPADEFPDHAVAQAVLMTAEFAPDGDILTTWDTGATMLWDDTGAFLRYIPPPGDGAAEPVALRVARFSVDGERILLASESRIEAWTEQGAPASRPFYAHPGADIIEISADGYMLSADYGGRLKLWSAEAAAAPVEFRDGNYLECADLSGRQWLLTCPDSQRVKVWHGDTHVASLDHGETQIAVLLVHFSNDGERIVTADIHGTVRIWEIPRLIERLRVSKDRSFSAVFGTGLTAGPESRNDIPLLTTHSDGARIWYPGSNETLLLGHEQARSADISHDGRVVVTRSENHSLKLWVRSAGERDRFSESQPFTRAAYELARISPVDNSLLTVSAEESMLSAMLWNLPGGDDSLPALRKDALLDRRDRVAGEIYARFSPDGRRAVIATSDGHCWLWRTDTEDDPAPCRPDEAGTLTAASFSTSSQPVWLVRAESGLRLEQPDGQAGSARSVDLQDSSGLRVISFDLAPEGADTVLVASSDGNVRLWNRAGELIALFEHPGQSVFDASFSPDGRRIVTAAGRGVKLWLTPAAVYETLSNTQSPPGRGTSPSR